MRHICKEVTFALAGSHCLLCFFLQHFHTFFQKINKAAQCIISHVIAEKNNHTIYINRINNDFLFYDIETSSFISSNIEIPVASATTPGILKLYNELGDNVDGTITQKTLTAQLKKKIEVSVDKNAE